MLKSYFLLAWRNIRNHKSSAVINVGGLALGLTTGVLVLLFLVNEFSYDKFHKHVDQLYLLMKNQQVADGVSTGRTSAGPMATALRAGMPEVTSAVRVTGTETVARLGDRKMELEGVFADTGFFSMMTFPAVAGNPGSALRNANSIILTESAARKLFGQSDALGKTLIIDDTVPVRVEAIVRDVPSNSTIRFEYICPFTLLERRSPWLTKWDDNRINTWLQIKPGANLEAFDRKATKLLQTRSNDSTVSTFVMPMAQLHLHSGFNNGKQKGGKIYILALVAIMGFFVLLIACINFMNIATARSEIRAREVGVRKVMGATRKQVMLQFFCEALTLTFFSLAAGIFLSNALLPVFNRYMNTQIRFDLLDWRIWTGMISIGLITAFIAGSYPALYLSRFLPAKVLRGQTTIGRNRALLRRVLVTAQFWVAIIFVIATIVVWQEINYVENRPIGYEQDNLLDIHAPATLGGAYSVFADQLGKIPAVKGISAGSDDLLNFGGFVTGMDWPGKIPGHEISIAVTSVGYNWVRTTGLQLTEGRDFNPAYGTDTSACLINESTVQRLGLKEPVIGQKLDNSTIIGVVRNFVYNNPSGIIAPMAIYLYKGAPGNSHFFVRIANDSHWRETIANIAAVAKRLDPQHDFDYSFTKEDYQRRFVEFKSYGTLATIFGGLAVFISCLGLVGLAGFVTERRAKEMSIRKVFGASVRQVMFLLSADFFRPVMIAFLLAIPAAAWALHLWLDNIAYHTPLHWTVFVLGGMLMGIIALTTAGWQGLRTAFRNPVEKLRNQ